MPLRICQSNSLLALNTDILFAKHEQILDKFFFSSEILICFFIQLQILFFLSVIKTGFVIFGILNTIFVANPIF